MKTLEGKEIVNAAIATLNTVEADANNALPARIHLLRTGKFPTNKYGDLEITASDIAEFVDNYNKGYGRPGQGGTGHLPVNFGHDKGGKAAAWITGLEADDEGNLWGSVEWTGSGQSAIEAKDYQFISSEFTPRCLGGVWASAEGLITGIRNVFTGAALTNIPMFNGNKGIMASAESTESGDDKQTIYINATEKEQQMPTLAEVRIKDADKLTEEDKQVLADNVSELSTEEKTKFNIEATAEKGDEVTPVSIEAAATSEGVVSVNAADVKAMVAKNKELEAKVEAAETAKTDLEKRVDATEADLKERRTKEITAAVDAHVKRGAIKTDSRDKWIARVEADATVLEDLKDIPSNPELGREAGSADADDNVSALEEARKKAKDVMAAEGGPKDFSVALSQVFAADSALETRYNEEVRG